MSSERTAARLSRILAMLPWIIEHDGADIEDLVERFDYENKADLVKDLHLVFMTGLPGYGPGDLIDVDVFDDEVPEVVTVGPSEELEELHHEIRKSVNDGRIGCMSVLAVVDGTVIWEQGFGWADRGRKRFRPRGYPRRAAGV